VTLSESSLAKATALLLKADISPSDELWPQGLKCVAALLEEEPEVDISYGLAKTIGVEIKPLPAETPVAVQKIQPPSP
jgi:hypothetical protein